MNARYVATRARVQCAIGAFVLLLATLLPAQAITVATPAPATQPTVLVMGDSLSAGYGLAADQGWVALLEERLADRKPDWQVVNASISGETSAGGRARIVEALARHRPRVVVIELGANDGLRGLPLAKTRANLARMVQLSKQTGAEVLLVGMRMPPNLGRAYTAGFAANYRAVAEAEGVALLPFLLEPVAAERGNFQPDHLHPTAAVQPKLRDHVWKALAPLLD